MGVLEEVEKRIESKSLNQDSLNIEIQFKKEEYNKVLALKEKYSEMAYRLEIEIKELVVRRRNAINIKGGHKLNAIFGK